MATEPKTVVGIKEEVKETSVPEPRRVGDSPVGIIGIILITVYLILFSVFLIYSLVTLWPVQTNDKWPVTFLFWTRYPSYDVRLFFIVAIAGALGSLVHALRSLSWYIGNRALVWSWLAKYILLPFIGATLGTVFYFLIRGGFFSPGAGPTDISPFGFAAVAGLIGMFSEQAVLKLKEVAETLLAKPQPGTDDKPQQPREKAKPEAEEAPQERTQG
jgi:hypothetical protein